MNKKRISTHIKGPTVRKFNDLCEDRLEKPAVILREIVNKYFEEKNKK